MLGCEELGQQESFFLQKWSIIYLRFSPVTQFSNQLATQFIAKGLLGLKLDLKRISRSWESLRLEKRYWAFTDLMALGITPCCQQQKPIITKNLETSANAAWLTDNLYCRGPFPCESKAQNWPQHMKRFYALIPPPPEHQGNNPYNKCPVFPTRPMKYNRTFPHKWATVYPCLYYPEKATRQRAKLSLLTADWCK